MIRCATAVLSALAALGTSGAMAATTAADPLHTPECTQAMRAVSEQEAEVPPESQDTARNALHRAALLKLENLRKQAARICLGTLEDPPRPQRLAQPPVTVAPVLVPLPLTRVVVPSMAPSMAPSMVLPVTRPLAVPAAAPPPVVLTNCDAGGCNASDGSRLMRSGTNLTGPRGVCTRVGSVLQCP